MILIGGIFRSFDLVFMFLLQAMLVGFFFGLVYSILIKQESLIDLLNKKPILKTALFLSPALVVGFYLWFLPLVAPSLVFRFMPDRIRHEIVSNTVPKFKVGDDIEILQKALPGYLNHIENGSGNISATMENFAFVIQVHSGKIIRLEYGKSQFDIDGTIYGKLQEEPCS